MTTSSKYVIWKDRSGLFPDYPWMFEGDQWGDTGACRTFEEVIATTVGMHAPDGPWLIQETTT